MREWDGEPYVQHKVSLKYKNPIRRTSKDKVPADRFVISVNLLAHFLCTFPVQPEEDRW